MRTLIVLLCLFIFFGCSQSKESNGWKLIYKNDNSGKVLYGNKENLLNAVRSGYPIRIG